MTNTPIAAHRLSMRCHHKTGVRPSTWCGAIAPWLRAGSSLFADGWFCAAHHHPSDIESSQARRYRRVRLQLYVDLAGVSLQQADAQTEAVERVRQALEAIGARVSFGLVVSAILQNAPPPAQDVKTPPEGLPR